MPIAIGSINLSGSEYPWNDVIEDSEKLNIYYILHWTTQSLLSLKTQINNPAKKKYTAKIQHANNYSDLGTPTRRFV